MKRRAFLKGLGIGAVTIPAVVLAKETFKSEPATYNDEIEAALKQVGATEATPEQFREAVEFYSGSQWRGISFDGSQNATFQNIDMSYAS
jgi:hypothetical protein